MPRRLDRLRLADQMVAIGDECLRLLQQSATDDDLVHRMSFDPSSEPWSAVASPSSTPRLWRTKASMTSASLRTIATPNRRMSWVTRQESLWPVRPELVEGLTTNGGETSSRSFCLTSLRFSAGRRLGHLGKLDHQRVDSGLVDLHRRIVADGFELRVASFAHLARLQLRHDLLARLPERQIEFRRCP